MRAVRSPRPRSCGVRAPALAALITALMTGMTAGLWPPGAGDASVIAAAGPAGSRGRAVEVPGLAALHKRGGDATVFSVSCASAGSCAVGGGYVDQLRHGQGFVAVERGGRWGTAIEVPGLGALNTGGEAEVNSVSCAPAGTCAAGGYYLDRHHDFQGFVVSQTG